MKLNIFYWILDTEKSNDTEHVFYDSKSGNYYLEIIEKDGNKYYRIDFFNGNRHYLGYTEKDNDFSAVACRSNFLELL